MNAMSNFERHNTGGHSLFNFVAKQYSLLTNFVWQPFIDDMGDMRRE